MLFELRPHLLNLAPCHVFGPLKEVPLRRRFAIDDEVLGAVHDLDSGGVGKTCSLKE